MVDVQKNELQDSRNQETRAGRVVKVKDFQTRLAIPEEAVCTLFLRSLALLLKLLFYGYLAITLLIAKPCMALPLRRLGGHD